MKPNFAVEEFIQNPSKISNHMINIISQRTNFYESLLKEKGFFKSIKNGVKIRMWYLEKYQDIYDYTQEKIPQDLSLKELYDYLKMIIDKIALNNLLLTYAFIIEKVEKNNQKIPLTKEDEKNKYFKKMYEQKITRKEFDDNFGHYALNPFEVSSKRFCEYDDEKLRKIARLASQNNNENKKKSLKRAIKEITKNRYSIYAALREELKYKALILISRIRFKLLDLEKKQGFENIFEIEYNEIKGFFDEI